MHVVAPKEASTGRSKGSKESGLKEPVTTSLLAVASKEKFTDEGVEDFESRPHKAVSFVVERDKETQE